MDEAWRRPQPRALAPRRRSNQETTFAIAGSVAALLIIGWLDHITGSITGFPLGIAYVLPVAMAAWLVRLSWAIVVAGLGSLVGLLATLSVGELGGTAALWNAAIRSAVLILVAMGTSAAHNKLRRARTITSLEEERADRISQEQLRYEALFHAVTHDARGPLTTIMGIALTLERTATGISEEQRDLLHRVALNAERLDQLLESLLTHDRLRSTGSAGDNSGNIGLLARRLVRDLEPLATRQVKVEVGDLTCAVDAAIVERMVENLLTNSAVHTPEGAHIWIRGWSDGSDVILAVEDDGPGVPEDDRAAIFLKHQQGTAGGPGHGLGLAMVATFADLYGGSAWVEDRAGGGSSFRVRLPSSSSSSPSRTPDSRAG